MVHCVVLAGGNERLGSQAGPSRALTVFLLALKTFSAAWTWYRAQVALGPTFFPSGLRPCLWSLALWPRWRGGFSPLICLSSPRVFSRKHPRDEDCGCFSCCAAVHHRATCSPGATRPPWQGPDVPRRRFSISRSVVNPSKFG